MDAKAWIATPDGLRLAVRLTPKGGRDALEGVERLADGRPVLKARVRAAASEGLANAALIRLLADALGVPPRRIVLAKGETARLKHLDIAGDPQALAATLERMTRETA